MKQILLILSIIFISKSLFAQDYEVKISIDTLKTIECRPITDKLVQFKLSNGSIWFSKESIISVWMENLNVLNNESYLEYFKKSKTILFDNSNLNDTIIFDFDIPDTLRLIEGTLKELVVELIDQGNFALVINNKQIDLIIKLNVYKQWKLSGQRSINYITNDGDIFWECIPYIREDYYIK